jgi:hypothetical protein
MKGNPLTGVFIRENRGDCKARSHDITQILAGAFDAHNTALTAAAVLAHPYSTMLDPRTVRRFYQIGHMKALPAPMDVRFVRAVAESFIAMDEVRA